MLTVSAHECGGASTKCAADHGGRAVAEKALLWWLHATTVPAYKRALFFAKVDDDSLPSLHKLLADLRAYRDAGHRHLHYGSLSWRAWEPSLTKPNGACGPGGGGKGGPPDHAPKVLRELEATLQRPDGECARAFGPYPFADGSLQVYGRALLDALARSPVVEQWRRSYLSRAAPPLWTHEDAGIGYLMYRAALLEQKLPITYGALPSWSHARFWLNWAEPNEAGLVGRHTVYAHRMYSSIQVTTPGPHSDPDPEPEPQPKPGPLP